MCDDDLRNKLVVVVCHICSMIINIQAVTKTSIMPYSSLFEWTTDYAQMYMNVVFFSELIFLNVHLLELTKYSKCAKGHVYISNPFCKHFEEWLLFLITMGLSYQFGVFLRSVTYINEKEDRIGDDLYEWVTKFYGMPDRLSITQTINDLQRHEECCGSYNYTDYYNSTYANLPINGGRVVPLTCYRIPEEGINATGHALDQNKIYDKGCFKALIEVYDGYFQMIGRFMASALLDATDVIRLVGIIVRKEGGCRVCCRCDDDDGNVAVDSSESEPILRVVSEV